MTSLNVREGRELYDVHKRKPSQKRNKVRRKNIKEQTPRKVAVEHLGETPALGKPVLFAKATGVEEWRKKGKSWLAQKMEKGKGGGKI